MKEQFRTVNGVLLTPYGELLDELAKEGIKEQWCLDQTPMDIFYGNEWFHYDSTVSFNDGDVIDIYVWVNDCDYAILM